MSPAPTRYARFIAVLFSILFSLLGLTAVAQQPPDSSKGLAGVLQAYVDKSVLAGAVTLVADRDKVLDISAVGYADLAAHVPMTIDDLFWIASMSKPITAAA